jgi:hypothetical protein
MISVYEVEARKLAQEKRKPVLVRDVQPIAEGLEVPQYYGYFPGFKSPLKYAVMTSTAFETLYTRKGENVPVCEIVTLLLPQEYPKTYAVLRASVEKEFALGSRFYNSLSKNAESHIFVEETGKAKFALIKEVREERFLPHDVDTDLQVREVA